jgi:hypothetical protein
MTRKAVPYKGVKHYYYYCPTTKKRGCTDGVNLKETELAECILDSIKAYIASVASLEAIISGSDGQSIINALAKQYAEQIEENERQLTQVSSFKSALYENMISGNSSKDDYRTFKAKYNADELRLSGAIENLKQQLDDTLAGKSERLRWTEHFKRFGGLTEIDRRTVVNLIQSIKIESKTEISITFNYQSEYENALAILRKEVS